MKKLLLQFIVCGAALLPFAQAQAAPAAETAGFAQKSFGGFYPGKEFSFTVEQVISSKAGLDGVTKKSPVPSGIPNFKKGQKVKFTIGKNGELKGPGFTIKYEAESGNANVYVNRPKAGSMVQADTASVFKTAKNKPTSVALSFFKAKVDGFNTTVYSVYYTLD